MEPAVAPRDCRRAIVVQVARVDHPRHAGAHDAFPGCAVRNLVVMLIHQANLETGIPFTQATHSALVRRVPPGTNRDTALRAVVDGADAGIESLAELLIASAERSHEEVLE